MWWPRTLLLAALWIGGIPRARADDDDDDLATACFGWNLQGEVTELGAQGPCKAISAGAPFTHCCAKGDTCLVNGLCHAKQSPPIGSTATGYYLGGCNDRNLATNMCNYACKLLSLPDVTYDNATKKWRCCGSDKTGKVKCEDPTFQDFPAPAPIELALQGSYTVPGVVETSKSKTTTSSPSMSSSITPLTTPTSDSSSNQLSSGAKAGIGIGASIVGFMILAGILYIVLLRRRVMAQRKASATAEAARSSSWPRQASHRGSSTKASVSSRVYERSMSADDHGDGTYNTQYSPRCARGERGSWKDPYNTYSSSGHATYDSYPPQYQSHADPRLAVYPDERKCELDSRASPRTRTVYHEKSGGVAASELQA